MLIRSAAGAFAGTFIMTICAFGQVSAAPNTFTTSSSFPPVGIASTETVQVILTNTANGSLNTTGLANVQDEPVPSCKGSVAFYNASGTIIGTAATFTLTTGQIAQVSLPYASTASTSVREMIRAVVSLTNTLPAFAPCSLSYSLATFDTATGATHATLTGAAISGIAALVGRL